MNTGPIIPVQSVMPAVPNMPISQMEGRVVLNATLAAQTIAAQVDVVGKDMIEIIDAAKQKAAPFFTAMASRPLPPGVTDYDQLVTVNTAAPATCSVNAAGDEVWAATVIITGQII